MFLLSDKDSTLHCYDCNKCTCQGICESQVFLRAVLLDLQSGHIELINIDSNHSTIIWVDNTAALAVADGSIMVPTLANAKGFMHEMVKVKVRSCKNVYSAKFFFWFISILIRILQMIG